MHRTEDFTEPTEESLEQATFNAMFAKERELRYT